MRDARCERNATRATSGQSAPRVRCDRAGLVDEFALAISPVLFGGGRRLFEAISREVGVELVETIALPCVTHVRYVAGAGFEARRSGTWSPATWPLIT